MKFRTFLPLALVVFLVSLIVLYPSFHLALFGDDWLSFERFRLALGPGSTGESNYLTFFLNPYGPEDMSVGLLQLVFGYNSTYYFVVSYILRLFAALSIAPLTYYLTKNRLAVFTAMLFMSITVIGLDATNWVFNMPSYLCIGLFNLFLYFLLKSRTENNWKLLGLSGVLFYLTYVSQPIRMPPLLFFTAGVELFWAIYLRTKKSLRLSLIRIVFFTLIMIFIDKTGHSTGGGIQAWIANLNMNNAFQQYFQNGQLDLVFYPFVILGGLFLPDISTPNNIDIFTRPQLFFSLLLPMFAIFSILSYLLIKNVGKSTHNLLKIILIEGVALNILILIVRSFKLVTLAPLHTILLVLSGYIIIWVITLFIKNYHNQKVALALFISFGWTIGSFILTWFRQPDMITPTTYRYLITSAVGVSLLLATIISMGTNAKKQVSLFCLILFFIILHIFSTRSYISSLLDLHSQEVTNKIWSQIPRIPELGKTKEPLIFYFDGNFRGTLHNVLIFGFPAKIVLLQDPNIREYNSITIDIWDELVSAVKDGKSLKRFGLPQKPLPVNNVYSFNLVTKENLLNTTEETRVALNKAIYEATSSAL